MPAETVTIISAIVIAFGAFAVALIWADSYSKSKRGPVA